MQMSVFGAMQMSIVPKNETTMEFVIVAQNRRDTIRMDLQAGESVDQFSRRIKTMLMTMFNGAPRANEAITAPVPVLDGRSFEEVATGLKNKTPKLKAD